jgi:hypothetical protein
MHDDVLCRLYALALSLVPDPNVAGELFMEARDEADLRRRAAAWLWQRGIPEPSPQPAPAADSLSEEDRAYAIHLARRTRRRRHTRKAFSCLAAAAALVAGLVIARPYIIPVAGLAAQPAFSAEPQVTAEGPRGIALSVYQTEATPGSVTLWWSLDGPGAADLAREAQPSLLLSGDSDDGGKPPTATETATPRRNRLTGKSTFRLPILDDTVAFLRISQGAAFRSAWIAKVSFTPYHDPAARVIAVNQRVYAPDIDVTVTVQSITLAHDYTSIQYRSDGGTGNNLILGYGMVVLAGNVQLTEYGLWHRLGDNQREVAFAPVPPDVTQLVMIFPRLITLRPSIVNVTQDPGGSVILQPGVKPTTPQIPALSVDLP